MREMSKVVKRTDKLTVDEEQGKKRKSSKTKEGNCNDNANMTADEKPRKKKKSVKTKDEKCNDKNDTIDSKSTNTSALYSVGELFQGTFVKRPSETVKSPYLADVKLDTGDEVIAWAPMLDLGGLLKPGRTVRMTKSKPGGKGHSSHQIQLVGINEVETGSNDTTWIGANPNLGNYIAKALLNSELIAEPVLGRKKCKITKVQSEVKMKCPDEDEPAVRSDFVVNDKVVVEVKSCVCADYHIDSAPDIGKNDRYYTVKRNVDRARYQRAGIFPIGKPGQKFEGLKVVSERGIKHLRHLAMIARGEDHLNGYKESALLLIVNRGDCVKFKPCKEACPVFAEELKKAVDDGVRLVVVKILWDENGNGIFAGLLPADLT